MNAPRRASRNLTLESLESRTLLAADPFGLLADFDLTVRALTSSGQFDASFSTNFGNAQLVLNGHGVEVLTIDLDRLPSFVTNLKISSFATVNFVGTDRVDNLIVSDVGAIVGSNLSVTKSLHVINVGSVVLASAGAIAVLKGTDTSLSVRSLGETMILSDLQKLTLDSESTSLFVIGLNSDQILNLKYRPETISLAGLPSSSVHLVDKLAALPAPEMPSGPVNAGSTGSGTIVDPAPTPALDPVLVITLPLNERTRAFIAELRDVLRSSSKDSQQLVFEFMAQDAPNFSLQAATTGKTALLPAAPRELEAFARGLSALPVTGEASASDFDPMTFGAPQDSNRDQHHFTDRPIDFGGMDLPIFAPASRPIEIDATWPIALSPLAARDNGTGMAPNLRRDTESEKVKIQDTFLAFGSYLVDRVSAELSPGEQSLFLLVDPKPARGSGTNPTTALEQFARGSRTSLSNLRQVMG